MTINLTSTFDTARQWINKPYRGAVTLEALAWAGAAAVHMTGGPGSNHALEIAAMAAHMAAAGMVIRDLVRSAPAERAPA